MSLNEKFLRKLTEKLFSDVSEREAFESALKGGRASSSTGITLPNGEIYQLDNSSVFAASILKIILGKVSSILDVCAAPGGKSVYAWNELKPEIIVSNETINKRIPMLISNLKRCGVSPCGVTCLDSEVLAGKFSHSFDLVIVDAPCSGQSLLAKGEKAPGALNPATINLNSNRQKRIIANSGKCVSSGGYLAYMTCTFSQEENEKIVSWFLKKFPEFSAVEYPEYKTNRSAFSEFPCYRLYPQEGKGAGAFFALLNKQGEVKNLSLNLESEKFAWKNF